MTHKLEATALLLLQGIALCIYPTATEAMFGSAAAACLVSSVVFRAKHLMRDDNVVAVPVSVCAKNAIA